MTSWETGLTAAFGALTAAGGVAGYLKAGSVASAAAGTISGAVLLACAAGGSRFRLAALATSSLLAGAMGVRYSKTGKFMPAGLVAGLSTAMTLFYMGKVWTEKGRTAAAKSK